MVDLPLSDSIYLLRWGNCLVINFFHLPFRTHDNCTSCNDLALEVYLFILGVVYQVDGLGAAITLLVVLERKDTL